MAAVRVIERSDMPGGLPAVWVTDEDVVTLYLRHDLPEDLASYFRDAEFFPGYLAARHDRIF